MTSSDASRSMAERRSYLRREVHSLYWGTMGKSQRHAFERLVTWLEQAVEEFKNERSDYRSKSFFEADPETRLNKTFTVDGERGTGKSSLLYTLARATTSLRNINWHDEQDAYAKSMPQVLQSETRDLLARLDSRLGALRGRLVWLDVLDMETQKSHSNFLASILTRIETTVERILDSTGSDPCLLRCANSSAEKARIELRRLASEVAAAWDGNLQARAANIDLDTYASEEMRTERSRLEIASRFAQVLDQLARDIPWPNKIQNPIFILPVDDFDLNPVRCLELLQLIRMLHHTPNGTRLATIVMGDVSAANSMLKVRYIGEFARIGNIQLQVDSLDHLYQAEARKFATEALRKLLPDAQRVRLEQLRANELFNFRPVADMPSIAELLAQLPYELLSGPFGINDFETRQKIIPRIQSLLDFLMDGPFDNLIPWPSDRNQHPSKIFLGNADRWKDEKSGLIDAQKSGYSVTRNYEVSPRQAVDLWHHLMNVVPPKPFSLEQIKNERNAVLTGKTDAWDHDLARRVLVDAYQKALETDPQLSSFLDDEKLGSQLMNYFKPRQQKDGVIWWSGDLVFKTRCGIGNRYVVIPESEKPLCPSIVASLGAEWHVEVDVTEAAKRRQNLIGGNSLMSMPIQARKTIPGRRGAVSLMTIEGVERVSKPLEPRTAGLFMLAHDVFILDEENRGVASVTPLPEEVHLAVAHWRLRDGATVDVPWLAPQFRSFWGWDHFKWNWHAFITEQRTGDTLRGAMTRAALAYQWLTYATAAFEQTGLISIANDQQQKEQASQAVLSSNDWQSPEKWQQLASRIGNLAREVLTFRSIDASPRSPRIDAVMWFLLPLVESWLRNVLHLLAPESGVEVSSDGNTAREILKYFLSNQYLFTFWKTATQRALIVTYRKKLAARFVAGGGGHLATHLFASAVKTEEAESDARSRLEHEELSWISRVETVLDRLLEEGQLLSLGHVPLGANPAASRHVTMILDEYRTKKPQSKLKRSEARIAALTTVLRALERRLIKAPDIEEMLELRFGEGIVSELLNSIPSGGIGEVTLPLWPHPVNEFENGSLCPESDWWTSLLSDPLIPTDLSPEMSSIE